MTNQTPEQTTKKPTLQHKIDFSVIITATNANPNGDPLNGNRPRQDNDGYGEMSDVCIKRKIRNRLQDMGNCIFVQSDDRSKGDSDDEHRDNYGSLKIRAENTTELKGLKTDRNKYIEEACKKWIDVRSFGQVFPFDEDGKTKGVSFSARGPVSIQMARSVDPVEIVSEKISSSVNNKKDVNKEGLDSNRMGDKHFVRFGLYVFHGSINCQLAEKTGFTDADAELIKEALCTLFENDSSAARPEGSMEVRRVYWWNHNTKTPKYSSAMIHRQLKVTPKEGVDVPKSFEDYECVCPALDTFEPQTFKDPTLATFQPETNETRTNA